MLSRLARTGRAARQLPKRLRVREPSETTPEYAQCLPLELPPLDDKRPIPAPRRASIVIEHSGRSFLVHSGRDWKVVKVNDKMVGHRFGEFVLTRKNTRPPKKTNTRGNR